MSARVSWLSRAADLGYNFNRLWAASATSNLGDGVIRVALPLLVVQLTDSPAAVAGLTVAANLSWLLLGLPIGALNDRLDRRRVILYASIARSLLTIGLIVAAAWGVVGLPFLYAFALLMSAGEVFADTASPALIPRLVARSNLQRANARRLGAAVTMNEFIGPALGGALFTLARSLPFVIAAAAYSGAAALISLLRGEFLPVRTSPDASLLADVQAGLRYLLAEPTVRVLAVWSFAGNMAGTITFSVLVLYAVEPGPLGLSEPAYGLLMAAMGAGGLGGTLLVGWLSRHVTERNLFALATLVMALDSLALAVTTRVVLIIPAIVIASAAAAIFAVTASSLLQQLVPDELFSRVTAGYRILLLGGIPAGAIVAGALGELTGDLRIGFALATVMFVLVSGLRFMLPASANADSGADV